MQREQTVFHLFVCFYHYHHRQVQVHHTPIRDIFFSSSVTFKGKGKSGSIFWFSRYHTTEPAALSILEKNLRVDSKEPQSRHAKREERRATNPNQLQYHNRESNNNQQPFTNTTRPVLSPLFVVDGVSEAFWSVDHFSSCSTYSSILPHFYLLIVLCVYYSFRLESLDVSLKDTHIIFLIQHHIHIWRLDCLSRSRRERMYRGLNIYS